MSVTVERVEYLLLFDGVPTAFVTDESVDAAYVATLGEFTRVHAGLSYPRGLAAAIDVSTGMLTSTSATFTIDDVDDTLAALFASSFDDATELLTELLPGATAGATEYSKHIGTELVGPAGERHRCSCVPGWNIGQHHYSSAQSYAFGLGETPVSDTPLVWPGRRCALYRLVRTATGTWPDLTVEANQLAARVWFGTCLGQGTQSGRTWSIRCAGQESWAMGSLGVGLPKEPLLVEALTTLDAAKGECTMRATLQIVSLIVDTDILETYVLQEIESTYLVGATTYAAVAAALNLFLDDVEADASSGTALSAAGLSALRFSTTPGNDGIIVRWDRAQDTNWVGSPGPWYTLRLILQAHEKVWKIAGYDPAVQNSARDPVDNEDQYGQFERAAEWYPGHWRGSFYAANAVAMLAKETGDTTETLADDFANGGFDRRWPPIYSGGAQVFDMDATGQEFRLRTLDPVFLLGSKAVPLMADPADPSQPFTISGDVGPVTTCGLMAIRGVYRREGDEDTAKAPDGYTLEKERREGKTTQVALVCWRRLSDGSLALDVDGFPVCVVYAWLEPRLYGVDYPRITGTWASWRVAPADAQPTTARPLLAFERGREGDCVPEIYARLLASTGTAGEWYTDSGLGTLAYGLGGTPVLDVGANDLAIDGVGDELLGRFTDAEFAGLGLAVPASMIAATMADDTSSIESALFDFSVDPAYRCKAVAAEETSARKLVTDLLAPTGLCMSLAGGKFGLFDPWTFRPAATTGNVTSEMYAGTPGEPESVIPEQALRKLSPIDRVEISARVDVTSGGHARQVVYTATDPGAQYRAQTMPRPLSGAHLVHPALTVKGADWPSSLPARWSRGFRWWGQQHFEAKFTVAATRAGEFWPGSIVSITDEWIVHPLGVYGVAQAPGFVTSRTLDCAAETCEVTCIVSADAMLLYAPAAVVVRYDDNEDGEGYRLFCRDDALGCRNGANFDVDGFVEPSWSTLGGDALIEVFAFDHVAWSRGIYGEVASIDTSTPGSTCIVLTGALTGATWLRDQDHVVVLRNAADQTAAWVAQVYAPLCDKDGTSDGTLGKKWRG